MILNRYNFVLLTAHIELKINFSNELDPRCSQVVTLMALNNIFTIQEINLNKQDLSYSKQLKEIKAYWNNELAEYPSNNHCKIFCD